MPAKNAYFIAPFLLVSQPQAPRFSFDWPEENDSQEPDVWTWSKDVAVLLSMFIHGHGYMRLPLICHADYI